MINKEGEMAQMTPYLWVVERLVKNIWMPTYGVSFNKVNGMCELRELRKANPDKTYQLSKYMRKDW